MTILQRMLNLIDYRLMDHGERVAYIMMRMLWADGEHDADSVFRVCLLALLHDIGAIKTEGIDALAQTEDKLGFETHNEENHCAYGYLYLQSFLEDSERTEMVLYHHTPYSLTSVSGCRCTKLADMIFLANKYDLLSQIGKGGAAVSAFENYAGDVYSPAAVKLFNAVEQQQNVSAMLESGDYQAQLYDFAKSVRLDAGTVSDICRMLVFLIDFRSPVTVTHTVAVVSIATALGRAFGLDEQELEKLRLGGMLHDLGKISTPIEILEKPGKLTPYEFSIMRDHVTLTERILSGCLPEDVVRIAARHHERMDGSGYPRGLRADELTLSERILAVADIASALLGRRSYKNAMPASKVREIIKEEMDAGKLCPIVTGVFLTRFNAIMSPVDMWCDEVMESYYQIRRQYADVVRMLRDLRKKM